MRAAAPSGSAGLACAHPGQPGGGVGGSVRQVKVGDQVLFSPEDQHEVEVHGEDLIILRERDVHAVAAERIEESTGLYL